jgi:hypothetical protein
VSYQTIIIPDDAEICATPLRVYDKSGHADTVPLTVDHTVLEMSRTVADAVMAELKRALSRYPD